MKWLPYEWSLGNIKLARPAKLYTVGNYREIVRAFKNNHPGYVIEDSNLRKSLLAVPKSVIRTVFQPALILTELLEKEKAGLLDDLEAYAVRLVKSISKQTRVPLTGFGIHGSISLGMHNPESDIDIAVYGANSFSKVLRLLGNLCREGHEFTLLEETIFDVLRRNRFIWNEKRVVINAIRTYGEIGEKSGEFTYQTTDRHLSFTCVVEEDWESVFRPAVYKISQYRELDSASKVGDGMKPCEVVSMIGEFRGIASKGNRVKVSGSLERVVENRTGKVDHYRVVVGSGEEKPQDEFIWSESLPLPY